MSVPRTIVHGPITIKVDFVDDDAPDLSYLGSCTDRPTFPAYDRATGTVVRSADAIDDDAAWSGSEYRFIHEGCGDWSEDKYVEQDARRLEDYGNGWSLLLVRARAYVAGVLMASVVIGGMESDATDADFAELIDDAVAQADQEARDSARSVCLAIGVNA